MSFPILPPLPFSLKNGVKKTPNFGTILQKTAAGMGNAGVSLKPFPTWDFEVDLNFISGSESLGSSTLAMFVGMYIQCNGRANLFLMTDPNDSVVTAMPFATADGTSTAYQLTRSIGGVGIDVIQNINGSVTVFVNGTPTSVSLGNTGIVTFGSAPTTGAILSWSGNFYHLCRFADDSLAGMTRVAFNPGGSEFWTIDGIKFSTEFVPPASAGAVVSGVIYEIVDGGSF